MSWRRHGDARSSPDVRGDERRPPQDGACLRARHRPEVLVVDSHDVIAHSDTSVLANRPQCADVRHYAAVARPVRTVHRQTWKCKKTLAVSFIALHDKYEIKS